MDGAFHLGEDMLIRNSALYAIAKLFPGVFGLATTAALTRLLDPQQYGLYGLTLVIMTSGSMVLFDWLGQSLLRFHPAGRKDPGFLSTFMWMFVALGIVSALALGTAMISGIVANELIGPCIVGLLLIWASSWFELVSRLAVAQFRPIEVLRMNVVRSVAILAMTTALAGLTGSPIWTAAGAGVGILAGAFLGGAPIPRLSIHRFDGRLARDVTLFGAPLAAGMSLFIMIDAGSRVLLERLDSPQALGVFTAAAILAQSRSLRRASPRPVIRWPSSRWSAAMKRPRSGSFRPMELSCSRCSRPRVWASRLRETASQQPFSAPNSWPALRRS